MLLASSQGEFFGDQPLSFAPASKRSNVKRIGVVDVGSNSVRMVVFEGHHRAPSVVFNEKVMCGLGARLQETGALDPQGKQRGLRALRRFAALAPGLHVGALAGVGTAAIRDAVDGPAFRDEIERETGIRLTIASGADEARLAAQGVLFGNPRARGVVIDLGGASLEFAHIAKGKVGEGLTTQLGPLRLARIGEEAGIDAEIKRQLASVAESHHLGGGTLYLVGGSWRALARAAMSRSGYPVEVIHEFVMDPKRTQQLCAWLAEAGEEDLAGLTGISSARLAHLPLAARLLNHVIDALEPGQLMVSAFGLREGICLENLADHVREQDPLIASCKDQELRRARVPGFGAELADWVETLLPPVDRQEARLMRAAAYLADVNWRTHPDFRAQGCWETVTRTTLTDIGHKGRVWLGAALVIRHKARWRKRLDQMKTMNLLTETEVDRAVQLGLILRLGGTVAGHAPGILRRCKIMREGDKLVLSFEPGMEHLAGEEVEKRLGHAARALELEPEIRLPAE
ncbi:MAG: Ppx/GppA family phosphatase [Pseudomonadota bacterium]